METEEKKKNQREFILKLGWILFLLAIALIIGFLMYPKIVDGLIWPLNKTQTCTFFNLSGTECDSYWCDTFLSCNWSSDSLCICKDYINNTIYTNITQNVTIYQNITINNTNLTAGNLTQQQFDEVIKYIDNQTRLLRDNLVDRIENQTVPYYYSSNDSNDDLISGMPYWFIFGIILAIISLVGFLAYIGKTKKYENDEMPEISKKQIALPKVSEVKKNIERKTKPKQREEEIEEIGNEYDGYDNGDGNG